MNLKRILIIIACMFILNEGHAQASNWELLGPVVFPTNISGQINGMGRVCQIKFDPGNANTMYACSASGGFWKSVNAGVSWSLMGTDMLPLMGTSSCCIDHTNSNIIYLSSGDPNYYGSDLGIWKTTNGGNTWNQINTGIGTKMAVEMLMDPANNQVVLAATNSGLWKTTDGGASWSEKIIGNQFTDMQWQPLANSSIVYASSMNKFFRSADKGDTWVEVSSGFTNLLAGGTRISVSAANPAIVYVGTVNQEGTIFRSSDTGNNFTLQHNNPLNSLTGYDSTGGGQGNYNFCIEANPSNPDQLFLGSHNLWRSNDGGVNWTRLTDWWKELHTDMHDFSFQPGNSNSLFQANDGGVWLTTDTGHHWVPQSNGLAATENYHAAVSPLYSQLISTGTQDNGELVYIGNTWKTNRGGDWTTKMQLDYTTQKFVYYFDDLERRALPSGGGNTYNLPPAVNAASIIQAFSPDDQNVAYVCGNRIWQTKNLMQPNPVWTEIMPTPGTIKSFAVVKNHPNIFAYSSNSRIYISYNALGPTPTFVNYTFPIVATASSIAISAVDTNLIFVVLNGKVYKSVNAGVTFTDYSGTLPNIAHKTLFLDDYSADNSLYVGNTSGVYYRNNSLADWVNYSGVLPTIASIRDIMYFNDGGMDAKLYVSYYGRGTWQTKLENNHNCASPVISSANWSGSQLLVNWNNTAATSYEIQDRETGTLVWNTSSVNTNNAVLNSMAGCNQFEIRVRGICPSDSSLWSARVFVNAPSNALNNDFDGHQDIGAVGAAGSVCFDSVNQRYTVYASGEDIWDKQDEFHFLYKKVHGDVSISARVKYIGNIYGWAKGGVMIRETLNTDSKHAICALTPGNGFAMQYRTNTNDWSDNVDTAGAAPGWVKLVRTGNNISSYFSSDGISWDVLHSAAISMTDTVYVGLANCSHIDSTINDAIFDHIVINGITLGTTGIEQNNAIITIFPNPANNVLNIMPGKQLAGQSLQLTVYNSTGNKIIEKLTNGTILSDKLDISTLAKGFYFLEVIGEQRHMLKFVKE
jgi:photosystem II stability/assembly factor-like uncharacterized protein/regulation of enolase protein 1 (concanavalin A-like superfamily)